MIQSVQVLRAIACYMVVVHHILDSLHHYVMRLEIDTIVFASGVDVFFVLSGFIMAEVTHRRPQSAGEFLTGRFFRIAPIYYLLTVFAFLVSLSGVTIFGRSDAGVGDLLLSLSFLPIPGGDGIADPILFVGWSLNYEMMFYLVFATSMLISGTRSPISLVALTIVALWAAACLMPVSVATRFLGNPIVLEFVAGIVVWRVGRAIRPEPGGALLILLFGLGLLASTAFLDAETIASRRVLYFGVPVALIVYAAVCLEMPARRSAGLLVAQGDASYSIYLVHPFALLVAGKLLLVAGLVGAFGVAGVAFVLFVCAGVAGTLFHGLVERPIADFMKHRATAPSLSPAR
jgi:exopolysaccharide production protein ExoZ